MGIPAIFIAVIFGEINREWDKKVIPVCCDVSDVLKRIQLDCF